MTFVSSVNILKENTNNNKLNLYGAFQTGNAENKQNPHENRGNKMVTHWMK